MSNQFKERFSWDWCERIIKIIDVLSIQVVSSNTQYDVEGSTNEFTVYLRLDNPSSTPTKKRKAEDGTEVTEDPTINNEIYQKVGKLYKGVMRPIYVGQSS